MDVSARRVSAERQELLRVLGEARSLLARYGNDFAWSGWENAEAALREIDGLIATLESGRLPSRLTLRVLFLPTGPVQEVSISSGWGEEFRILAGPFDAAEKAACAWRPWRWLFGG